MQSLIERHLAKRAEYQLIADTFRANGDYHGELSATQKTNEHYRLAFLRGIKADESADFTPCTPRTVFINWATQVLQTLPDSQFNLIDRSLTDELATQIARGIISLSTAEDIFLTAING